MYIPSSMLWKGSDLIVAAGKKHGGAFRSEGSQRWSGGTSCTDKRKGHWIVELEEYGISTCEIPRPGCLCTNTGLFVCLLDGFSSCYCSYEIDSQSSSPCVPFVLFQCLKSSIIHPPTALPRWAGWVCYKMRNEFGCAGFATTPILWPFNFEPLTNERYRTFVRLGEKMSHIPDVPA